MSDQKCVLVTRPGVAGSELCGLLEDQGWVALRCPTIEIVGPSDRAAALAAVERLALYDMVVFVSRAAVDALWDLRDLTSWPGKTRIAAIGNATSSALEARGVTVDVRPPADESNSESLLRDPALQALSGQRIAILCAPGGRMLLSETLIKRGAEVEMHYLYQRRPLSALPVHCMQALNRDQVAAIAVTSIAIIDALNMLAGEAHAANLRRCLLVVISDRIARHARELGFNKIEVSQRPDNRAIVRALKKWK